MPVADSLPSSKYSNERMTMSSSHQTSSYLDTGRRSALYSKSAGYDKKTHDYEGNYKMDNLYARKRDESERRTADYNNQRVNKYSNERPHSHSYESNYDYKSGIDSGLGSRRDSSLDSRKIDSRHMDITPSDRGRHMKSYNDDSHEIRNRRYQSDKRDDRKNNSSAQRGNL